MLRSNYWDEKIVLVLALMIYIPSDSFGSLLRICIVLCVFLVKYSGDWKVESEYFHLGICIIFSPIISYAIVFMMEGFELDTSLLVHEMIRMVFCFLLILVVIKLEITFNTVYLSAIIVLIPNLIIQVLQYMGNQAVFSFIVSRYVTESNEWTHLELARQTGSYFRSGSIFLNPNVYMVIPLVSLVVFLHRDIKKGNVFNYLLIVASTVSCFLTGSRTATVTLIVIMVIYFFKYAPVRSRVVIVTLLIGMYNLFGNKLLMESRALQLGEEDDADSLLVKIYGFKWFWISTASHPIYWLTGAIGSKIAMYIDCEWGHIYSWYGFFGLWWYIRYLQSIYYRNDKLVFYSKPMTYVCVLVAITASVLLCMPIFSFVATILLADVSES